MSSERCTVLSPNIFLMISPVRFYSFYPREGGASYLVLRPGQNKIDFISFPWEQIAYTKQRFCKYTSLASHSCWFKIHCACTPCCYLGIWPSSKASSTSPMLLIQTSPSNWALTNPTGVFYFLFLFLFHWVIFLDFLKSQKRKDNTVWSPQRLQNTTVRSQ